MKNKVIKIRGARQHNLKNINLDIPKNKLVVLTGVSGSGKSSLAYNTIYAEGQRRYVESLSTYARQFLGIMEKPDVDTIEGLSPAISINQKTTSRNPRSTVGTATEIYDYLRLLFAKVGHPHCPICEKEISSQSLDEIVASALELIQNKAQENKTARFLILSPVVVDKKGEFSSLFDNLKAKGFKQIRIDGLVKDLSEELVLIKTNKHTIEVVIDRISVSDKNLKDKIFADNLKSRLAESCQQALKLSDGLITLGLVLDKTLELPQYPKKIKAHLFSQKFACPVDNIQLPEVQPRTFSFNSPHGACSACTGLGKILKAQPSLVFSEELSITEGGILPFMNIFEHDTWYARLILAVCNQAKINPRTPIKNLNQKQKDILLYGTGKKEFRVDGNNKQGRLTHIYKDFPGIISELERRYVETASDWVRRETQKYMRETVCSECLGARLKKEALGIKINGLSISETTSFTITAIYDWINNLAKVTGSLNERERDIATPILKEITTRLNFLISVGLEYLTLDRTAATLAGGEAQRIRLASQIGSGLTGVLYVLDEPTIGLHQRDNDKLINTLKKLRDLGNTVVVVEHDKATIKSADFVIDFGPGAGKKGGYVVATGTPTEIAKNPKSLTGKFLCGKRKVKVENFPSPHLPARNRYAQALAGGPPTNYQSLTLKGCQQFNLKNIDVTFPLGKLVAVTGVSGSGKSTLLVKTLYSALQRYLNPRFRGTVGKHKNIQGIENVDKIVLIDQSPIGRTPRSNPATYTKVFDHIRDVFALTREARAMGFKKGRFSFNVKGGRCGACDGQGQTKIEMQFMNDIWIKCEVCRGARYNAQTLEIDYKGKNIAQILGMNVSEAKEFFHAHTPIVSKLETLEAVGLGYIELGQPATMLSGGEAQRVKLSSELAKKATGKTIYILDEPTTGLHFADIEKLLRVLKLLVSKGNSVFIIEHNLDVIKNADWIIDLGPDGGESGGEIVAEGTVNDVKKVKSSYTGQFLGKIVS